MSKKNANQDYYKVSGRQEKGTLPSDIAPDKQGMSRSQARVARGEAAPPHHDDSAEAQGQQERPAGGHDDRE